MNTVQVKEGKLFGFTTDGAGCFKALENHGLDFSGRLLLLGNGGAARALAFEAALRKPQLDLTIACREGSQEKAGALAREVAQFLQRREGGSHPVQVATYEELEAACAGGGRFDLLFKRHQRRHVPQGGGRAPCPAKW